jgi:hypothetical protein
MPSSQPYHLNQVLDLIIRTHPRSVLDIGPGFGKYGFLCREYLELWQGRYSYEEWKCRIDCIEGFGRYILPHHRLIYNEIYTGDALQILPDLETRYDLILLVDVLEHFTFGDGMALLRKCLEKADQVIVASPKVVNPQGDVFDNEFERHRFEWKRKHFREFPLKFFVPHHSTLICYLGKDAGRVGREYRKNFFRMYVKKNFRFLRPLRHFFPK